MRRVAHPWDRYYHQHQAPWRGERKVRDLFPLLAEGPVLELGCGNGKTLKPLQEAGIDVVGLDVSFHALRRLGTGVLADAASLPFEDASFSAVLDLHCSGHLLAADRARNHEEVLRVLRVDGVIVCERLGRSDLRASKGDEVEPWTRRLADGRSTHFSDEASLRAEWETCGARVGSTSTQERTARYDGQEILRQEIRLVARR